MKPATKTLGALGIAGAPFLFLEMYTNSVGKTLNTSLTGVYDLLYMLGWMCSVAALLQMRATGTKKRGMAVLYVQLFFLTLANASNLWVIVQPNSGSGLYRVLDMFWPVSNVWMLVSGIAVARAGKLQGWRRYIVLVVGLWFPAVMALMLVAGKTADLFYAGGIYSTVAWALMGWAVLTTDRKEESRVEWAL